jgi:DUF4097 and DUF4098 domain-containing protein YvlB
MRIWSLHPKYLDAKGLVALWRETLLAKKVLEGKTVGYRNHPQLNRFKEAKRPVEVIDQYLAEIYLESVSRNYNFDIQKINWHFKKSKLTVTTGQLNYEVKHLLVKLKNRDLNKYEELKTNSTFDIHPLFKLINGDIERWELLNDKGNITSR